MTNKAFSDEAALEAQIVDQLEPVDAEFLRADELKIDDLVVDEHGERKFVAFDRAFVDDRVRVWPAAADIANGWPRDGLLLAPGDVLLVVRR